MTEKLKQKAKESATNYVQQLVDHSRTIENDLLLQCQLRQSHQDGYIAGVTEKCMGCDKVGKWRNYNRINEILAQSYKEENEQLKSRLDEAIKYIKDIEEENKKLVHSNNLAERLVGMITKFDYMSKEDKKLVILEAEGYLKGVR